MYWIRTHKYDEYHRFDWYGHYDYPIVLSNDFEYCLYNDAQTGYHEVQDAVSVYTSVPDPVTPNVIQDQMIIDRKCK